MRIIVQKFGGSSVSTPGQREKVAQRIAEARGRGFSPVVVISAMGRYPAPYATDTLLNLVREVGEGADHRELDLLMACGEIVSAVLMAHTLTRRGIPARALTGFQAGLFTSDHFGDAVILQVNPVRVLQLLEEGRVPVVAGFQGMTANYEITTLGRGGSDTTATALGAALKAEFVEIYTDVEGVLSADPRVYENPRVQPHLTYEEVGEMANEGARVLHDRSVDLATQYRVPLWVKGTFCDGCGSLVSDSMPREAFEKTRVVSSVVSLPDVAQIILFLEGCEDKAEVTLQVLNALARRRISLDLINLARAEVYFIVREDQAQEAEETLEACRVPFRLRRGCAKISIVGAGMRGTPGVMARIQQTLYEAEVEVFHSTDSNITISCLVRREDVSRAVAALHREFLPDDAPAPT